MSKLLKRITQEWKWFLRIVNGETTIVLNSAHCHNCNTTLISEYRHDYNVCNCGQDNPEHIMVDGGYEYQRHGGTDMPHYEHRSVVCPINDYETISAHKKWGTRGKHGDQPSKYVKLIECTTNHLQNILGTQRHISQINRKTIKWILKRRKKHETTNVIQEN